MTLKKSLEKRIRGWFPKEPTPSKVPAKIDFRVNPQVTVPNLDGGTLRIAKFSGFFAVLWAFFVSFLIIANGAEFHGSVISPLGWLFAGLMFGLVFSAIFTRKQIKLLEKNHKFDIDSVDLKLIVIPLLLFVVSELLVSAFFYSFLSWMLLLQRYC